MDNNEVKRFKPVNKESLTMLFNALTLSFLAASYALVILQPVQAQQIPLRGPIPFEAYDQDSNNFITQEEFNSVRGQRISANAAQGRQMRGMAYAPAFSDLDLDGDGKLSRNELLQGQQLQMQKHRERQFSQGMPGRRQGREMMYFSNFDSNADKFLSEEEFIQARNKRIEERAKLGYPMRNLSMMPNFELIDTNNDGRISQQEFTAHQMERQQQMQQRRQQYWQQMQQRPVSPNYQGMPRRSAGRNMPLFNNFDLNADGSLTEDEFIQARNKRIEERAQQGYQMRNLANLPTFQSIDTNADGKISQQEFSEHQLQHHQQRQMVPPYY